MSKETAVTEYINELKDNILRLNNSEREEVLDFYQEFIFDAGFTSRAAIENELGSPKKLARKILADYSLNEEDEPEENIVKSASSTKNVKTIWIILLGLLAIPAAIPVALFLIGILFGLFMAIFGIFIGAIAIVLSLFFAGIFTIAVSLSTVTAAWAVKLFYVGMGIILMTLALMIAPGVYFLIKLLIAQIVKFVKWVGSKFIGRKQYYKSKEEN